jgi:hypothetical protein
MKTKIFLLILLLPLFWGNVSAQVGRIDCATLELAETYDGTCITNSDEWENFYRHKESYIPYNNGTPFQSGPIMTIEVNFNIVQRSDGSGNFHNTQADKDRLIQLLAWVNQNFAAGAPSDPFNWVTELTGFDTRIRFSLGNTGSERIYFYQNDNAFCSYSPFPDLVVAADPERMNHLNIYFTGGAYGGGISSTEIISGGSGYTSAPTVTFSPAGAQGYATIANGAVTGIIITYSNSPYYDGCPPTITLTGGGGNGAKAICHLNGAFYASLPSYTISMMDYVCLTGQEYPDPAGDWVRYQFLAHELGHTVGLYHTYVGGGASAQCNDPYEYLEDVFGVPQPGNCPHQYTWSGNAWAVNGDGITNNLMSGNCDNMYTSPQQAGQAHRALALKSIRKFVNEETYSSSPLVLDANFPINLLNPQIQTWDFDIKLYSDLVIENGAQLTVKCKVVMPYLAKIIVKPGGKLIIDGGTITTDSKTHLWKGIEVWGNSSLSQTYANQGYVNIINGGKVEKAEIGILCGKRSGATYDDTYSGGMVVTSSSTGVRPTLENNNIGVYFRPYTSNGSLSNLSLTDFSVNSAFYLKNFSSLIKAENIRGVRVSGCSFSNFQSTDPAGIGIDGTDVGLLISGKCTSQMAPCPDQYIVENEFNNLNRGIYAINTGVTLTMNISRSNFTDNLCGIYLSAYTNPQILINDFVVPNPPGGISPLIPPYGLYLDYCTGYHVEENDFLSNEATPYSAGIIINNSGTAANEVYRNTFTNLKYGTAAQDINKHPSDGVTGLCFICNDYRSVDGEIVVTTGANGRSYGVAELQQQPNGIAAFNIFYINGVGTHWDFYNEGYTVYYMKPGNNILLPQGWRFELFHRSGNVFYNNDNISTSRYCPSKIGGGGLPDSQFFGQNEVMPDSGFVLKESMGDLSKLTQIMNSKRDITGAYARNSLIACKKVMYQEPFIEPDGLPTKALEIVSTDEKIRLFPNPAKESFTVSRTFSGNNVELRLYNIVGKIVFSTNFEENSKEISTKDIPNGLYLVSIYSNNQLVGSLKVTIAK